METGSDIRETGSTLGTGLDEARDFFEEFGIHVLLDVTLVGIVDSFLKNTVLSMLVGHLHRRGMPAPLAEMAWQRGGLV